MAELIQLSDLPVDAKIALLKELDYDSDGLFVLKKNGEKFPDRYTEESIKLNNMIIFPGSTIILDNNPLSISSYLEEFGDVL